MRRDGGGDCLDTRDLVGDRLRAVAELLLEHDARELVVPRLERRLAVLGNGEPRVSEARRDDVLVALLHDGQVAHLGGHQRREAVREHAVRVFHREVALVRAHRGHDDIFGDLEVRALELAAHADRILAEVGDLAEQRLVAAHVQPGLALEPCELGPHALGPLGGIDDHAGGAQRVDVGVWVRELDRSGREEAMAARDARGGEAGPHERHDLAAVQRDQPLHRPHERRLAPAPALRLRPHDARRDAGEQLGQDRAGIAADDAARGDGVQALLAGDLFRHQRGRVDLVLRGEPEARLCRRTVGPERGAHGRADDLFVQVGLALREAAHDHREAARRAEGGDAGVREALGVEARRHLGGKLGERAREHLGRDFLAPDLEQQVSWHGRSPRRAARPRVRPRARRR